MFIPAAALDTLETFQAACLNAWISERKGHTYQVTWRVLCGQWGKSRRCLYGWMKLAGIMSSENYGRRWLGIHKRGSPHIFDVTTDEQSGNPNVITNQGGQLWAYFQRGNTYTGNAHHSRKGACKAINAHSGNYKGGSDAERWETDRERANFTSIDAFLRAKKKHRRIAENAYIMQPKRSSAKRKLWSLDH
jgi:hypothetical protein